MSQTLLVNEIFFSIQGESTWAGLPCVFVRLTGCHLRCAYCDTEYAFHEGRKREIDDILREVNAIASEPVGEPVSEPGRIRPDLPAAPRNLPLVEITGGEPLLQPNVHVLMRRLCDAGRTVLIETDGVCDISACDPRVIRIMDIKTPGSGEAARNNWANIAHLTKRDEVKFVICSREDYEWSRDVIRRHALDQRVHAVLVSAAAAMAATHEIAGVQGLPLRFLAEWVLADRLPVRVQTQLHKLIWDPMTRGV